MRRCPQCGYRDPPYWRPAKMHNPSGDIDIARIGSLELFEKEIAGQLLAKRGQIIVDKNENFAYLLGKRAVWVRRVAYDIYRDCGKAAFKPPVETSTHNILAIRIPKRATVNGS